MRLYPWNEVLTKVDPIIRGGADVYQQFLCEHCGVKQTMGTPNSFHRTGICEECGKITNIEARGMNYMLSFGIRSDDDI